MLTLIICHSSKGAVAQEADDSPLEDELFHLGEDTQQGDIYTAGDEIGEATIPVASLQLGYRAVPLRNLVNYSEIPYASILCHFAVEEVF